jgi:hypothetical protein
MMAIPNDPYVFQALRTNLRAAEDATDSARTLLQEARQQLADVARSFPPGTTEYDDAEQGLLAAERGLQIALATELTQRFNLAAALKEWLEDDVTHAAISPDADYRRLSRTDVPIALFPVRLETRFDVAGRVLKVRIYPDEALSNLHERGLLPEEKAEGEKYWQGITPGPRPGINEQVERWGDLAKRFGVSRAAYIVRVTTPGRAEPPPLRATSPSRPATAVLPDRFVVLAYKNGVLRHQRVGLPIPEPLDLTPDPSDENPEQEVVADGFEVPANMAWTVRYDLARDRGMAIDIDSLAPDELSSGFDRVVVLGVKTSMPAEHGTEFMRDLFDAHHFTRGLALVPQGTPTNNVPGRPTPFTMAEPTAADSFETERMTSFPDTALWFDHERLSKLLLGRGEADENTFRLISGAEPSRLQYENYLLYNMKYALWPATLGYFMHQLMNSWAYLDTPSTYTQIFSTEDVDAARTFFANYVWSQGPAPAFRIGAVPYGVLPALALSRWTPRDDENASFPATLRRLLPFWQTAAKKLHAVVPGTSEANVETMRVIAQKASSDGVFVRNSIGVQTATNLSQYFALPLEQMFATMKSLQGPILTALGHPEWAAARAMGLTFAENAWEYSGPLVTADPRGGKLVSAVAPDDPTAPNYIALIGQRDVPLSSLKTQDDMPAAAPPGQPKPLLFLLLRHSLLLEAINIGRRTHPTEFSRLDRPLLEFEHWGITVGSVNRENVFHILETDDEAGKSVFQRIQEGDNDTMRTYRTYAESLALLARTPVRELERLFTEVLDLCSHRLDAWITALATRRIIGDRAGQYDGEAGVNYVGAYGWVENLKPRARATKDVPGVGAADVQPGNGGFIHAPTLRHATTAAILRSGRMAERSDPTKYAIELPSERARRAHRLIDGLRADQPLGALLGYQFERGLRERHPPNTETLVLALRKLYPLVANKSGLDGAEPADRIAAANVVDGEKLRRAGTAPSSLPFGSNGLPASGAGRTAIEAELAMLNELMDAMGDLVISEAVHQVAAGDVLSAQAAMGFLPEGGHPPEPEITRSQTVGVGVNHRVALILEGTTQATSTGWIVESSAGGASPRGKADPFVDAWVAHRLGDATTISATVHFKVDGVAQPSENVALADLAIGALDFIALAQSSAGAGQGAPLERRIHAAFLSEHTAATDVTVSYDAPTGSSRTIAEVIELARSIGVLFGRARALRTADLGLPESPVDDAALAPVLAALTSRVNDARDGLATAIAGLGSPALAAALVAAADYAPVAFPAPNAGDAELAVMAQGVRAELTRRAKEAEAAAVPAASSNAMQIDAAVSILRTIFGKNTLVVMPAAVPQQRGELARSLESLARPIDFDDATTFDAHHAPSRFLRQAMRTREALSPLRRFDLYSSALGMPPPALGVAQLPFVAEEDWAGRSVPKESRLSLLLLSANGSSAPDPSLVWRGLVLDEWTELVPSDRVETGISFHYDSQNCEAPQAILLCAHSGRETGWNLAELSAIVNETIDLAGVRAVDSDMLQLGQLTPAICLAMNPENKTVSTAFPGNSVHRPATVTP